MKRTLKGRGRYFPGCCYGMLITLPVISLPVIILTFFPEKAKKLADFGEEKAIFIFMAVFLLLYWIGTKIGKKIFDFTKRKYEEKTDDSSKSYKMAVFTEFGVFVVLMIIIPLIFAVTGQTLSVNSGSPAETINGWD